MIEVTGTRSVDLEGRGVADPSVPTVESGHRPHLDGMRTIAVYLVVAFHAGADRFTGGFIGVDVFFVLSGYLVTSLLLRDLRAHGGIRLTRFYSRRFRRLLPAAFVTLLVTGAVFSAVASPVEASEALRAIRAAFLYVTNWFFIQESSDYFAADIDTSPVVHFWSLAIEEQFYLLWPLLLAGLYRLTRSAGTAQWHAIRATIVVAGIASAAYALHLSGSDLSRAYYGTDTRAYQLLAGAVAAMSPALVRLAGRSGRAAQVASVASLVGLVVAGSWLADVDPIQRGILATALTCVVLVTLEASTGGLAKRALSLGPITYLGRISYGTYLWHWPVIVVARQLTDVSPVSLFLLTCLSATGIASLSFQLLEAPIRVSALLDRYRRPVIVAGLALSALGALVLAPAVVADDQPTGTGVGLTDLEGTAPVPAGIDWSAVLADRAGPPDCLGEAPTRCVVVEGTGTHLLLMGDSHAGMLVPGFTELARARGAQLSVAITNTCPWPDGLLFAGPEGQESCRDHKADWEERVVPALDPDVVVVVGRTVDDPANTVSLRTADGTLLETGSDAYRTEVRAAMGATVERFVADGRRVVMVEPIPYAANDENPLPCLSEAAFLDECRYVASPGPMPAEVIQRRIADADPAVWSLDLDALVCPYLPICDPIVDGMVVKFDSGHLTATYARSLSDEIGDFLVANGILP